MEQTDPATRQAHRVGLYLRDHTERGTSLAVFGQEYSIEIAFAAERKSFTAPHWFAEYESLWVQPQKYLGSVPLGAIVVCPPSDKLPTKNDVVNRAKSQPGWTHVRVEGCEVLLHKTSASPKA